MKFLEALKAMKNNHIVKIYHKPDCPDNVEYRYDKERNMFQYREDELDFWKETHCFSCEDILFSNWEVVEDKGITKFIDIAPLYGEGCPSCDEDVDCVLGRDEFFFFEDALIAYKRGHRIKKLFRREPSDDWMTKSRNNLTVNHEDVFATDWMIGGREV